MSALFRKLNLTTQATIHVLGAPPSLAPELGQLAGVDVRTSLRVRERTTFALAFAVTQAQLDAASAALVRAAESDAILWIAYPKGSSRKYRCEFNRDSGWTALGEAGFEPVRQVAIDEDWSALRFRRAEHITALTRDPTRALSSVGRQRATATRATVKKK